MAEGMAQALGLENLVGSAGRHAATTVEQDYVIGITRREVDVVHHHHHPGGVGRPRGEQVEYRDLVVQVIEMVEGSSSKYSRGCWTSSAAIATAGARRPRG